MIKKLGKKSDKKCIFNLLLNLFTTIILLSLFLIGLFLTGCSQSQTPTGNIAALDSEKNQINQIDVGIILPLTGNFAFYGNDAYQGILLAEEELENKYGDIFTLYIEDHQANPTLGVNAFVKLKDSNNINAVITGMSPVSVAVSSLVKEKDIIQMAVFSSTPKYTSLHDNTFRLTTVSEVEDYYVAKTIKKDYNTVGILYINNDMGLGHKVSFLKSFVQMDGDVIIEGAYNQEQLDFRTNLLKIKNKHPEALYIVGDAVTSGLIIKQAAELQLNIPLFASRAVEDEQLFSIAGNAAEGLVFTTAFDVNGNNEDLQDFVKRYRNKYITDPTDFSAQGYEAGKLLFSALHVCNAETVCTRNYLFKIKDLSTVFGPLSFDENGDVMYPFMIKEVKNGKFVVIK